MHKYRAEISHSSFYSLLLLFTSFYSLDNKKDMQKGKDKSKRSFFQMGMLVSICVFLVLMIKSAIFGFSWASIVWLLFIVAYWCLSYYFIYKKPDGKSLNISTTAFLVASLLTFVALTMFDKNARPKMHAFEGAGADSIAEEDTFVIDETPDIVVYQKDTIAADTLKADTSYSAPEESAAPTEETAEDEDDNE